MGQPVSFAAKTASFLRRCGFSVLLVAGALGITLLTLKLTQIRIPFLFFAAILIAGWYGGRGPAWLAAGLSILAVDYYFEFPNHSLTVSAGEETYLVPFAICAAIAAWGSSWRSRFEASEPAANDSEVAGREKPPE